MKKERLNTQCRNPKDYETIMNNYMAITCIIWKKWTDSWKSQSAKTEPGRNRNYEQPNYKH